MAYMFLKLITLKAGLENVWIFFQKLVIVEIP